MEKIRYRTEDDGSAVVDYFVEACPAESQIKWYLYPRLPRGMDLKKGDEMGLGFMRDDTRQSYEDFEANPKRKISAEIQAQVIQAMEEGE